MLIPFRVSHLRHWPFLKRLLALHLVIKVSSVKFSVPFLLHKN